MAQHPIAQPSEEADQLSERCNRGRPTTFDAEVAEHILEQLRLGRTLRAICRTDKVPFEMPSESTVRRWADTHEAFSAQYARAREHGWLSMAEELLEIADDSSGDRIATEKGEVIDHEHIARSRLKVDTRKWLLSKALPKIYGDKVLQEVSGPGGQPLQVEVGDDLAQARAVAFAMTKALHRHQAKQIEAQAAETALKEVPGAAE